MDEPVPLDEKALETCRERTIARFKARMAPGERRGDPPLRAREARVELAETRRRLKARQESWDAAERAAWP